MKTNWIKDNKTTWINEDWNKTRMLMIGKHGNHYSLTKGWFGPRSQRSHQVVIAVKPSISAITKAAHSYMRKHPE